MLADQFLAAAAGARNSTALDETSRLLWRAHAEGYIADAEAVSGALQARRAAFATKEAVTAQARPSAFLGPPCALVREADRRALTAAGSTPGAAGDAIYSPETTEPPRSGP